LGGSLDFYRSIECEPSEENRSIGSHSIWFADDLADFNLEIGCYGRQLMAIDSRDRRSLALSGFRYRSSAMMSAEIYLRWLGSLSKDRQTKPVRPTIIRSTKVVNLVVKCNKDATRSITLHAKFRYSFAIGRG
jgi:hypothetical protein